jgi:hypothetical protein
MELIKRKREEARVWSEKIRVQGDEKQAHDAAGSYFQRFDQARQDLEERWTNLKKSIQKATVKEALESIKPHVEAFEEHEFFEGDRR